LAFCYRENALPNNWGQSKINLIFSSNSFSLADRVILVVITEFQTPWIARSLPSMALDARFQTGMTDAYGFS
jgi:hypothetical protein